MGELPSGTVTLLFTDIEGSTRLLDELGERYSEVLAEHRRVLRDAFHAHGGVEIDIQGDAFFYAFARATDAVAAAAAAQRALGDASNKLLQRRVSVRMGLHTGEPSVTEDGYVGLDVHRAARIAAAGHGGQVLLSQTTRDLLDSAIELCELGEHRLKDLGEPQRLYQLGREEFPPLRSLDATNLPAPATPLIGRERELEELLRLFGSDAVRHVTLTGAGGTGKTRLALEAAARLVGDFRDGVWFVDLSALRDAGLVLPTIGQTLGLKEPQPVDEALAAQELLLVLDNFEHLVDAAPKLAHLLRRAPKLRLLVTSRERLRLSGEHEYALEPLATADAVALFVARARAVKAEFEPDEHVAEICRRLDGLPLAIELASARVKHLAPASLLQRIERRLPLLTGGARDLPERQQTLRAAIGWSYELLSEPEPRLFARLAVFVAGCTADTAEQVCAADLNTLGSLVDKSLLRHDGERFWMLEMIREFASERLAESGEADELCRRHAEHFTALAEQSYRALITEHRPAWLERLEPERENFRSAVRWSLATPDDELALRLAVGVSRFWLARGPLGEGRAWLEAALARPAARSPRLRAEALRRVASFALRQGDGERARDAMLESIPLWRTLDEPAELAYALNDLANAFSNLGAHEQAREYYDQALELLRSVGSERDVALCLESLGYLALLQRDYERAARLCEESLTRLRGQGNPGDVGQALINTGFAKLGQGEPGAARSAFMESLQLFHRLGETEGIAYALVGAARVAAEEGEELRALHLCAAAESLLRSVGASLELAERRLHEETVATLRMQLTPDGFAAAWQDGASLSAADAVALAVQTVDSH